MGLGLYAAAVASTTCSGGGGDVYAKVTLPRLAWKRMPQLSALLGKGGGGGMPQLSLQCLAWKGGVYPRCHYKTPDLGVCVYCRCYYETLNTRDKRREKNEARPLAKNHARGHKHHNTHLLRLERLLGLDDRFLSPLRLLALEQLEHLVLLLVDAAEVPAEVQHPLGDAVVVQQVLIPHLFSVVVVVVVIEVGVLTWGRHRC